MASRYGRNQKRRAREQIAALEAEKAQAAQEALANQMLIAELRAVADLLRRLRTLNEARIAELEAMITDWDKDVTRMLGAYTAFRILPGEFKDSTLEFIRLPIMPRLKSYPVWQGADLSTVKREMAHVARLFRVLMSVERHDLALKHIIRLVQEHEGQEVLHLCYDVDDIALFRMGARDKRKLVMHIATQFEERANEGTLVDRWERGGRRHG